MLSIRLTSLKDATRRLFLETSFDFFRLMEASFACAASFAVDGHCNRDFYASDDKDTLTDESFVSWASLRPTCFQIIKGRRTPLSFRLVFFLSKEEAAARFCTPALSENADIHGFLLIIHYKNQILTATAGTSFHWFSPDRESERLWEHTISRWLEEQSISFTEL